MEIRTPTEFKAVILSGFGNDLLPLTADYAGEPSPKALLPIANKPMLYYVLNWLDDAGIRDVLLVCPTSHRKAIAHYINSDPTFSSPSSSSQSLDVQIFTIDQNQDIPLETSEILIHIAHRIDRDFILLPCDFVPPPSLKLNAVLNKFRIESCPMGGSGSLMCGLFYEDASALRESGEQSWDPQIAQVPVVYDKKTGTLLYVDSLDDIDRNNEEIELRMAMLWKYPTSTMSLALQDSHVYVCKRTPILDLLTLKPKLESFKEEFVPWVCKLHTQKRKRVKYDRILKSKTNVSSAYTSTLAPNATPTLKTNVSRETSELQTLALRYSTSGTYPEAEKSSLASSCSGSDVDGEADGEANAGASMGRNAKPRGIQDSLTPKASGTETPDYHAQYQLRQLHRPNPEILMSNQVSSRLVGPRRHEESDDVGRGKEAGEGENPEKWRCGVYVHQVDDGREKKGGKGDLHVYAARANRLETYLELNRVIVSTLAQEVSSSSQQPHQQYTNQQSLVSPSAQIGLPQNPSAHPQSPSQSHTTKVTQSHRTATTIKKSVIGPHCIIGSNVRINGSVVMDHCIIEDGAKIESSILARNTTVRSKAELVKCVTQAGFEVDAGRVHKYEKLMSSDWTTAEGDFGDSDSDAAEDEDEDIGNDDGGDLSDDDVNEEE